MPTQQQRQLIVELDELAAMVSVDPWNIEDYGARTQRFPSRMEGCMLTAANQFRSAQATLCARGHRHEPGVQCCERSSRSTRRPHQLQGRGYRDQQGTN